MLKCCGSVAVRQFFKGIHVLQVFQPLYKDGIEGGGWGEEGKKEGNKETRVSLVNVYSCSCPTRLVF
jgi:hypothetical protein